jgi:excinuclease UvrABC nuclease subunit
MSANPDDLPTCDPLNPKFTEIPVCPGPGVYLLRYKGVVVYVGKSSSNVFARLGRHTRDKRFDQIQWVPLARGFTLDEWEQAFIRHLRPIYNSMHK